MPAGWLAWLAEKLAQWRKWSADALAVFAVVGAVATSVIWVSNYFKAATSLSIGLVCHRLDPTVLFWEVKAEGEAIYAQMQKDPFKYPTYLLEILISNDPEITGLRIRMTGPTSAMPWLVKSNAFPLAAYSGARLPRHFPEDPDGVALPDLPTIGPNGTTTIRTVVRSNDQDLCSTNWVTVTHPSLKPLVAREHLQAMSIVTIEDTWILIGAPLLAGLAVLAYRHRRRFAAAGRAFVSSPDVARARADQPSEASSEPASPPEQKSGGSGGVA